jgi:hypothetical protein
VLGEIRVVICGVANRRRVCLLISVWVTGDRETGDIRRFVGFAGDGGN